MATRLATFDITTGADGSGSDDTRVMPTSATRPAVLRSVQMTDADGLAPAVTIYETVYDGTDLVYDYGDQLFYSTTLDSDGRVFPRLTTVDDAGVAISGEESGDIYFNATYLRCDLDNGVPSGTYQVEVTYETAGDYRF